MRKESFSRVGLNSSKAGFSLLEIIIVLALIAMLAGVLVTRFTGALSGGQEQTAGIYVRQLELPLTQYRIHMGSFPSTEQGLKALMKAPEGKEKRWKGPYVKDLPEDPWGNAYLYRYPGVRNPQDFDIWSLGPDGIESGDDIGNWKSE